MATSESWDEVEKGFRAKGYLAENIDQFRFHYRSAMADWFTVAEELNALGQRFYMECADMLPGRPTMDPVALSLQMMPRCLSGYQGSLILAERGLGTEAQVLVRGVMETAFWMGYLASDPSSAVPPLERETYRSEIGLYEAAQRHLQVSPETMAELDRQLTDMKALCADLPKSPKVEELASLSGYGPSYFFYKELSGVAAHLSIKSIHVFLSHNEAGEVVGHQIGPDDASVGKAVWIGCRSMILAIDALQRITDRTHHNDELSRLHERVDELEPYAQGLSGTAAG
jgi:hypothetical protein